MKTIAFLTALVILMAAGAAAADWQWPAQMNLGGFQISSISGTVSANGSGNATGTLAIPGMGNSSINLSRSAQGSITGSLSLDARVSGGSLRGNFTLTSSGLRGRGTLQCGSHSIDSPNVEINSRGEATGSGRLALGRLAANVDFSASSSSCNFIGEAPANAQVDTPMASYKLDGRVDVRGSGGSVTATLTGQVQRTGKVSNQVTTTNVPSTRLDLASGQLTISVGGVSVTFSVL